MQQGVICPVCGSHSCVHFQSCRDHTVSGETFDVVQCRTCGFKFSHPAPDEASIGRYYQSEDYVSHSNTRKGLINTVYQTVRRYTLGRKLAFVNQASGVASGRLLDVGCGTGEFLATMQRGGWTVQGLEPSAEARAQAMQNHQLEVAPSETLFDLPAGAFEVITLWHVLEHVHRLDDYLKQIKTLLKPEGTLIIAVPNADAYEAGLYGAAWAAYDVPRHLYHFTAETLAQLLARHGLKIVSKHLMPFDAFYVSLLSEKYLHGKPRLMSAFLTGLKSNLLARRDLRYASSLQYVVRKI